jgi:hypothetical protein
MQVAVAHIVAPLLPRAELPALLPRGVQPVLAELKRIGRLRDPRNVYMYCLACSPD